MIGMTTWVNHVDKLTCQQKCVEKYSPLITGRVDQLIDRMTCYEMMSLLVDKVNFQKIEWVRHNRLQRLVVKPPTP